MATFVDVLRPAVDITKSEFSRRGLRILQLCYGPQSRVLRAEMMSILHGRKINVSAKEVQWGNFRRSLIELAGIDRTCIASEDHAFEEMVDRVFGIVR